LQNPNENIKIIETGDGSHTLYNRVLNEHYHSIHGSINEAEHVFISKGLFYLAEKQNDIDILEVGFGTGLNAFLSSLNRGKLSINYTGLEPYPVEPKLLEELNYVQQIDLGKREVFNLIHASNWEMWTEISSGFSLFKSRKSIQEFDKGEFDLVYFDAFAPRPQPEMWEVEIFQRCYDLLRKGGVLVTYCAKGQVRRNMQVCGFEVERLEGPPGKREMLRALKK